MQSSHYISALVNGSAERDVQERIRHAERHALIKFAKSGQPSLVSRVRLVVGQQVVGFGRRIAGRPRRAERPVDVPSALTIAR